MGACCSSQPDSSELWEALTRNDVDAVRQHVRRAYAVEFESTRPKPDIASLRVLFSAMKHPQCTVQSIKATGFGDADVAVLAECLNGNQTVWELMLDGGDIGDTGAAAISQLVLASRIEILSLNRNAVSDQGAVALEKLLVTECSLRQLSLSSNRIGDSGVEVLASSAKVSKNLKYLSILNNPFTAKSAAARLAISELVKQRPYSTKRQFDTQRLATALLDKDVFETRALLHAHPTGKLTLSLPAVTRHWSVLFPALVGNSSITHIDLNDLKHDAMFAPQTNSKVVHSFSDQGAISVAEALRRNVSLQTLELPGLNIAYGGADAIASSLAASIALTKLNLSRNAIGDSGAEKLAASLIHNSCLQSLDLSFNKIEDLGFKSFVNSIQRNSALTELKLEGMQLNAELVRPVLRKCQLNAILAPLRKAVADENVLPVAFDDQLLAAALECDDIELIKALLTAQTSQNSNLNLCHKTLTSSAMSLIATALHSNDNVTSLNVSHNKLDAKCCQPLIDLCCTNQRISSLDLSQNSLSAEVGAPLGRMLASNSASLQVLKLAKVGLTTAGSITLAVGFSSNKVLSELDLSGNEISGDGISALTNALSTNATLRRLVLNQNPIGDAGYSKLADFLAANQFITELHLNETGASAKGLAKLFESIRENRSLNALSLSRVPIRPDELSTLVSAIIGMTSPQLQQLDLSGCSLGLIGVEMMANLISRLPYYLHVDLNDNLSHIDAFNSVFQRVQQIVTAKKLGEFSDATALKNPVVGRDGLPVKYSQQTMLDEMLQNNTDAVIDQLRAHPDGKLDYLRGLNLGAASQLFLPLRVTHSITMLDLEGSKLGDLGATEVANALRGNISIANINLNSNQIDSQGATSLAEAVGVSNVLQRIDLGRNRIGNDGALALASALRRNRSMRTLMLDENGIRDSGAVELLHAIEQTGKLTTFSVSEASLGNASAAVLAKLMAKSEFSLCDIRWNGKQIDATGASLLSDAMLSNNRVFNFHPWQAQNEAIRDVCQRNKRGLKRALSVQEIVLSDHRLQHSHDNIFALH